MDLSTTQVDDAKTSDLIYVYRGTDTSSTIIRSSVASVRGTQITTGISIPAIQPSNLTNDIYFQENGTIYKFDGTEWTQLTTLQGDSAYQVAVSTGYTGTEAEWIDSLKGKDGNSSTVNKDTILSTSDFPNATLGQIADSALSLNEKISNITNKVANLSTDGSSFSGDVSGADLSRGPYGSVIALSAQTKTLSDQVDANNSQIQLLAEDGSTYNGSLIGTIDPKATITTDTNTKLSLGTVADDAVAAKAIADKALVKDSINTVTEPTGIVRIGDATSTTAGFMITPTGAQVVAASTDGTLTGNITVTEYGVTLTGGQSATSTDSAKLPVISVSGTGAILQDSSSLSAASTYVQVSPDKTFIIQTALAAPTTLTEAGTYGEIRFDNSYMYRCILTGADGAAKWVKFAITDFTDALATKTAKLSDDGVTFSGYNVLPSISVVTDPKELPQFVLFRGTEMQGASEGLASGRIFMRGPDDANGNPQMFSYATPQSTSWPPAVDD